jgi:ribosomal protein S12 methylthiotransferase accessory factor
VPARVVLEGTHRVRTPEQTWEWIRPKLGRAGITRVADVTWLDEIGIPVFQAVRPNSLSVSVSQGKGISAALALARRHYLSADTRLRWCRVSRVDGGDHSFIPADLIRLDHRFGGRWSPPLFTAGSDGLASGNILAEALIHGMYEVVERDAVARAEPDDLRPVDLATIEDVQLSALLDRLLRSGPRCRRVTG